MKLTRSRKITFEGFYGFKNAGDDAFVEVASWGARKYWNCKNNVFLGNSLPRTTTVINENQFLPQIKGFDRLNLIYHLQNSDYLISAGGSTFGVFPLLSNKAIAYYFKSIKSNLKLGAVGVSVGPFNSMADEKAVVKYLKSLEFLALRDSRSYEYTSSLDLPYNPIKAFDLAALLPLVYQKKMSVVKDSEIKTVGLSICNYESYTGGNVEKEEKRNNYFKELVSRLAKETRVRFKVFIINGHTKMGDLKVSKDLVENIDPERVEIVPYLENVEKTWKEISKCDIMISTRLHASIFACYANVPFMLLEYHQKCSDFLEDVGQAQMYRLYDGETPIEQIIPTIKTVLAGNHIKPYNLEETISLSEKNFTETLPLD